MACQNIKKPKMQGMKWSLVNNIQLLALLLGEVVAIVSAVSVGENSLGYGKQGYGLRRMPFKSLSVSKQNMQQRRLKAPGNEIIPAVGSNAISEEPTCDELRAMWRYYKRQSRAELTNEIPQFGKNPFFDMLPVAPHAPVVSSFGQFKGRSRSRMRQQNPMYGRVVYKPSKPRDRGGNRNRNQKPFETVRSLLGKGPASANGGNPDENGQSTTGSEKAAPREPIVHLSPPPQPTKESSFEKLKEVFREERMRERGPALAAIDNREYGKIVLSPPRGQDGRRANKPRELMTAFEKIRFGHADDLLDEGIKPNLDVMKRRTLPSHVLKQQLPKWKQQFQKRRVVYLPTLLFSSASPSSQTASSSSRYFGKRDDENNNNNQVVQTNDKQQLDSFYDTQDVPSFLREDNPTFPNENVDFADSNVGSFVVSKQRNPPTTVEIPTCAEVEHQACNQTLDCSCIGFALYRCYLNECQILPLAFSVQDEASSTNDDTVSSDTHSSDIWHSEPIASEKLGIWEEPGDVSRLTIQSKKNDEGKENKLTDATYLLLPEDKSYA
ncbi:unnamed protein product [Orchesella dallaii]|uniref:Uncharacterized protein n=1 Tax=Orchesella dallaii TaxID=48710 RepID=A0ABP1PYT3_9HEXA